MTRKSLTASIVLLVITACSNPQSSQIEATFAATTTETELLQPTETLDASPSPLPTEPVEPTATVRPTATIDTDPAVYDNFDNRDYDGSFNDDQWRLSGNAPNPDVHQEEGVVAFSDEGDEQNSATVLVAKEYDGFQIETSMFFEAELMLSPQTGPGEISATLYGLEIFPDWLSKCFIRYSDKHGANCMHAAWDAGFSGEYSSFYRTITPGDWHPFRIEVNPDTMHFSYYIDEVLAGEGVPLDAERLRGAQFQFVIGISKSTANQPVVGYVDNVRIGMINP